RGGAQLRAALTPRARTAALRRQRVSAGPRNSLASVPGLRKDHTRSHGNEAGGVPAAHRPAFGATPSRALGMTVETILGAGIVARGVTKRFVTNKPADPGFRAALRSLIRPEKVTKTAVDGIDLTVDPGELVLLLGPNGAGKSTLIKILTGVIRPTAGEVRVAGVVPRTNQKAHARSIGVVFGQRSQLWWDLPVRQSYVILQNVYDIPPQTAGRRLAEFDEILGSSEFWDSRLRHLSLGQRVRADLAGALLHDPAVIFLDEPTIGMDVVAKDQVRRFLRRQVSEHGRCVLLTTHDMNEVKRLGNREVVINHGRIVADGDITELARRFGGGFRIRVTLRRASAEVELSGLRV